MCCCRFVCFAILKYSVYFVFGLFVLFLHCHSVFLFFYHAISVTHKLNRQEPFRTMICFHELKISAHVLCVCFELQGCHSSHTECLAFTNVFSHLSITRQDHIDSRLRDVFFNLQRAGCFQAAHLAQAASLQDPMCLHCDPTKKEYE